ncbi:MAG: TetR family transcriptional regulator [Actinomycetia bacterium]|nr:TetR family transcriptional regulator [Actinomycetes bacterium]
MSPRRAKAVRGRVGDDPATALREHLIDTAEGLLAERHAAALTTREIARAADLSDGVLYNYFADKNELVITALVRRYGRLVVRFDAELPQPGDATLEHNLLAYSRAALEMHLDGLPIVAGLLSDPELLRRFIDELHRNPYGPQLYQQRIIEYLHGEQRLGRLPAVDVEAATTLFTGATMMLALTSLMGMAGETGEELFGQLPGIVTILLNGINARS